MLVELSQQPQARRLEIDGYERTGRKAVECHDPDDLQELLGREDVQVKKVALNRDNSDWEAGLIDQYVLHGVADGRGRVERHYWSTKRKNSPFHYSTEVLDVSENSMTVHEQFERATIDVRNGADPLTGPVVDETSWRVTRNECMERLAERKRDVEQEIEDLQSQSFQDALEAEGIEP